MKILFFARLRDALGRETWELDDTQCPATVGALRASLCDQLPAELAEELTDKNVFCAVNKKVANEDTSISASDEIAFFPPMTGG